LTHDALVRRVEDALRNPLPGPEAQALMAPKPRPGYRLDRDPKHFRHASALLLLIPVDGRTHVVLTVRSHLVRHSGQVSMPGGVVEPGESYQEAAIREALEEIALVDPVRVLGPLTPLDIPVSEFRLHPIVATLDRAPQLAPADREVARIVEIPVATLLASDTIEWRTMLRGPIPVLAPSFVVGDVVVWGATAMVLAEFLALVGWLGPPSQ
jgi:8-oxo-dGTP pyrophosphatase MutT (NUDIX family)